MRGNELPRVGRGRLRPLSASFGVSGRRLTLVTSFQSGKRRMLLASALSPGATCDELRIVSFGTLALPRSDDRPVKRSCRPRSGLEPDESTTGSASLYELAMAPASVCLDSVTS